MPTAYQQGTIWQCDCGKTYKAIVVVPDYQGDYATISWNPEGWIARHRRQRPVSVQQAQHRRVKGGYPAGGTVNVNRPMPTNFPRRPSVNMTPMPPTDFDG